MSQQGPPASRLDTFISWVGNAMIGIAALTLAVMMAVTVIDVGGRYFFLSPLRGAYELVGILLVVAGTWGMGYCQLRKGNVRISILFDHLPDRMKALADVFAYLLAMVATGLVVWQGWIRMYAFIIRPLGGKTGELHLIYWPFLAAMVIAFAWVLLIFLLDLINSVKEVFKK